MDINKTLIAVGKNVFIDYYQLFEDIKITTNKIYEALPNELTHVSKVSRTSKARKIINEGYSEEAFNIILTSTKLDSDTKRKAEKLLKKVATQADTNIPDGITEGHIIY
jgi:hypothetical protein